MLTIKDLHKSFGAKVLFDGFSLTLPDSGFYCLSGPSGSGKTTLLRIISGLDADYRGTVETEGRISYVFQEDRLIPSLTALENVNAVCRDREKALYFLARLGMDGSAGLYPDELSGGMKRRTAIARALSFPHDIMLLDEPFSGLDDGLRPGTIELIKECENGRLVILVTHERDEIEAMGCETVRIGGAEENEYGPPISDVTESNYDPQNRMIKTP